jgi:ribosome-associated toxin RatA of RatAB toxin-antitoxin module
MPYVEAATVVRGDIDAIWKIVSDMPAYPTFMPSLVSVEVLETSENSTVTKWVGNVDGRILSWVEKDVFDHENYRIEYQQVSGDLKKFEGYWQLQATEEGVSIVLTVDFDLGIPMVATLINPILKKKVRENSEGMLSAIKGLCEK